MSLNEQFPFEFDDADVTLYTAGGGVECVIDHDDLDDRLVIHQSMPDGIHEQLLDEGLLGYDND